MICRRLLLAACLLSLAVPAMAREFSHARSRAQLDREQTTKSAFVTPHVRWGKPLPGGPVRALFIIHVTDPGTNAREVIELAQRFDLQADMVFEKDGSLYGDQGGEQRLAELLGKKYGVFVLGNVKLDLLPYPERYELLRQVVGGAGLVCVGPRPAEVLTPERQVGALAAVLGPGALPLPGAAYRLKQGRGVHLDWAAGKVPCGAVLPQLPYSRQALAGLEANCAAVGRAILWAAGRSLPLQVKEAPLAGRELAETPLLVWAATFSGPAARWEAAVRRLADNTTRPVTLRPLGNKVFASVPALRADEYVLELRGLDKSGAVAGAASLPFRVTSPVTVAKVQLSREYLERGEQLAATASLAGAVKPGDVVRFRARDSYGREVWRHDAPAGRPRVDFRAGPACSLAMTMEAALLRGGRELSCAAAPFKVTTRNRDHWAMVMWDAPGDALGYYAVQRMSEAGFNVLLRGGPPPDTVAAWGWAQIPYTTRLLDEYEPDGRMKPYSWNDQAAVRQTTAKTAEAYLPSRRHGVYAYSLGDETTTLGASTDESDLAAYRRWLAGQYPTIEALNQSWGSSYTSFDEIAITGQGTVTGGQLALEEAARQAGQSARWFDRQAFARHNYLQLCRQYAAAYKAIDPQARTGFEGAGGFGDDVAAIVATQGFWSPYPGPADEILRSLVPPTYPHSNWIGYMHQVEPILGDALHPLSNQCPALFWWRWDNIGQYMGYLAPDLDFYPTTRELNHLLAPWRWGVGDWLLGAERQHDGIALFYSLPASLAPRAIPGMFEKVYEHAHQGLQAVLEDLGLQYNYVTEEQVIGGRLARGDFKVLALPQTYALDPRAAEAIRAFAKAGGVVLADTLPGRFDQHLAAQAQPLDDLFAAGGPGRLIAAPARYREQVDKLQVRDTEEGAAIRRQLGQTLATAGVACPVQVTAADGSKPPRVEVIRWQRGGMELIGLFYYPKVLYDNGPGSPPLTLTVKLPAARWVHVVGESAPPRQAAEVTVPLTVSHLALVATSAQPFTPVVVQAPAMAGQGGTANVTLTAADGQAHPVRVELYDPAGRRAPWLEGAAVVQGTLAVPLHIAYDDPIGRWQVKVTDWVTGAIVRRAFMVGKG